LSAQNPATLELGSGTNKLTQSADGSSGLSYRLETSPTQWQELKNDPTTNHYTSEFGNSTYSVEVQANDISHKTSRTIPGSEFEHEIFVTDSFAKNITRNPNASISHILDIDNHPKIQFDGPNSHRMFGGSTQIYDTTTSLWDFSIDVNFSQNVTIDGNLDVDGNTTLDTLTVDESATFNESTNFNKDVTFNNGPVTVSSGCEWTFKEEVHFDRPIVFTHTQPLMQYDRANPNWLMRHGGVSGPLSESGLYWNASGGAHSFGSLSASDSTSGEDVANQFIFMHGGNEQVAFDMDTGTVRAKGDVIAMNDLIGYSTSDSRYKENVEKIDHALEKIDGIRGVSFDWKQNPSGYSGHDVGVIAQEVEKIIPEAVRTGGNGQKQVNYEKIIPLLIECIKELKAKIGE